MKIHRLVFIGVGLLVSRASAASNQADESSGFHQFHQHSGGDLDVVQCHHTFYTVDQNGGKPQLASGQESRNNPSRQYLPPAPPPPPNPTREEAPAASFDQPNVVPVENTLVSTNLQKSYNSLFGKGSKPELLPAAAQNVPANALAPAVPKGVNKVTSDDDDPKFSLERLCNDAFHSFLCKPITGPRRTPTGRLRPNAVLPPEILAGFSSSQDISVAKPENNGATVFPTYRASQSNLNNQRITFPPYSTTTKPTNPPAPFKQNVPEISGIPSPTNSNTQVISPEPSNEVPFQTAPQTNSYFYEKPGRPFPPQEPNPSNQNQQFIVTTSPPTIKPTKGYDYDRPSIAFPSNNSPQVAQPPQPPHDCNKHKNDISPVVANPSNEKPYFANPTTKTAINNIYTQKSYTFSTYPTTESPRYTFPQTTPPSTKPHDCTHHGFSSKPIASNPTNQNPYYTRPTNQPYFEPPKVPLPSNNDPQIVAQPRQLNLINSPKEQGYFYVKPSIPFPSPVENPSNNNPSFASRPTQRPFTTAKPTIGYSYEQPKIPFPSNNIAQIISSQPTQQQVVTTTNAPTTPCQHANSNFPPINSPTNQNSVILKPEQTSNGYVYDKPNIKFPPEIARPTNQDIARLRPFVTTTAKPSTGYLYNKPSNPLLLPNQNNNIQNSLNEPKNNGFSYQQKPSFQTQTAGFPPTRNFQNSFNSVSSSQPPPFDAITTAGYSYNKPKGPYPSSINDKLSEPTEEKLTFVLKHQPRRII